MLGTLGYEDIIEADNAMSAMDAVKENHFDLVLLDINMPQTSGLELGYELRYHQEDLAIIFQTAYDEHALKAFDIGAVGYLVKPFSMEQLQQSIERVKLETKNDKTFRLMSKNGENYYLLKPEDISMSKLTSVRSCFVLPRAFLIMLTRYLLLKNNYSDMILYAYIAPTSSTSTK